MRNCPLLVVDVQTGLVKEHPYNEEVVISNIKALISLARNSNIEVLYVRHDDGVGEELEYGTDGWQIYHEVAPNNGERIFEKHYNSVFFKTDLKEYLETQKIDTIILAGLQTEYCIDATLKSAFDHGYKVIIPEQTNSTFDNEYLSGEKLYEFYHYKIWNNRFANVLPMDKVRTMMIEN
ncbi:cysteine hydrolase family protein [Litchfieldia salsa]|uniref:Nicotinamidase-related amidase n=1 Tax=Litchfieldia salsa TaxID=930152 RepID=A0A1H0W7E7_9BACI|nr:cysteine hydrolase family protein [Litchfieldia salsa]SDP86722.1 Nicotinamidase-related amidase [Litchfieldia salsa]